MKRIFGLLLLLATPALCFSQDSKELVIVCFGNSTTAKRKGVDTVYAERIHLLLRNSGINNKIINSGAGGSHTGSVDDNDKIKIKHAMDRFDTAVLRYDPDWVSLNFGLNDSWQDEGINGRSRIPIENYRKNLSYFIDTLKKRGTSIVLLTPNPIGKKFEKERYQLVKKYAVTTRKLAREKNISFINSWKLFYRYCRKHKQPIDVMFTDGIHPNDTGHRLIAEKITEIVEKKFRK